MVKRFRLLAALLLCCALPAGHALAQGRVAGPTLEDLASLVELGTVRGGLALSPDGAFIALFERRADLPRNDYRYRLVVVPTHGGPARVIGDGGGFLYQTDDGRRTGGPLEREPVWSPDSQWVGFIAEREGHGELWRARVDGRASERVAAFDGDVLAVQWLRDGRLLADIGVSRAEAAADAAQDRRVGYRLDARLSPVYGLARLPSGERRSLLVTPDGGVEPLTDDARRRLIDAETLHDPQIVPRGAGARVQSPPLEVRILLDGVLRRCDAPACDGDVRNAMRLANGDVAFLRLEGFARAETALYLWTPRTGALRRVFSSEDRLACVAGERIYCLREALFSPRALVAIDARTGALHTLHDANPQWARFQRPRIDRLDFTDRRGLQSYAHLVYPAGFRRGQRYPMVIVQYRSRGFLRAGTGGEHPIYPMAAHGYFVLSVERPEDVESARRQDHDTLVREQELTGEENRMKLDAIDAFIARVERAGLVDPAKIAITGMSDGSETLYLALLRHRFAAAVVSTPPTDRSAWWLQSEVFRDRLRHAGGAPPWTGDPNWSHWWTVNSIAERALDIHTPLLFNLTEAEAMTGFPLYVRLREAGVPTEMYLYPDAYHLKWRPLEVLAAQERGMAWIDYWLRVEAAPSADDAGRITRWRALRQASTAPAPAAP